MKEKFKQTPIKTKHFLILFGIIMVFCIGAGLVTSNNKNKSSETENQIASVTPKELDSTISKNKNMFLILGESTAETTKLLVTECKSNLSKMNSKVFLLDTASFTDTIKDDKISDEGREKAVQEYVSFMSKYKVESLPTIIYIKDGQANSSSGKYIEDDYSDAKTDKDKKEGFVKDANAKLEKWFESQK